jgi:GPH family glycoside/pentoside/hexuronide:cation symporter
MITGFNVSHGAHQPLQVLSNLKHIYIGIPLVFLTVCLFAISRYELTHERMLEIRRQLEARRGVI